MRVYTQAKPVAATSIRQRVAVVEAADKVATLEAYLREQLLGEGPEAGADADADAEDAPPPAKRRALAVAGAAGGAGGAAPRRRAIVFCKTKSGCDHLAYQINRWAEERARVVPWEAPLYMRRDPGHSYRRTASDLCNDPV